MVDYAAIAAEASEYADAKTAFDAMSVEKVQTDYEKLTGSDLRIWAGMFADSYNALKVEAQTNVVAEMAAILIQAPNSMMDLNKPEVQAMVAGMVPAVMSQESADWLYARAYREKLVWPGLKLGHVIDALRKEQG